MDTGNVLPNTSEFVLTDCTIGATTDTSSVLLDLGRNVGAHISNNTFVGGVLQIRGIAAAPVTYSNAITIGPRNYFTGYTTAAIQDPGGSGWTITQNTFENGAGGIQKALKCTGLNNAPLSLNFTGNWLGDSSANNQVFVEWGGNGGVFNGNYVSAASGTGNIGVKASCYNILGFTATGNNFESSVQTAFDFNGTGVSTGITVGSNVISSSTAAFANLPVSATALVVLWPNASSNGTRVGVTAANLGNPSDGSIYWCSNCTVATPCAGGGGGAYARRLGGVWVCN